jgi:hypothetical protein
MTTEDDWKLAPAVRQVSDQTRQYVIDALERDKIKNNRVRAEAEASRVILIGNRVTEAAVQRVGRAIMRKLDTVQDWVSHSELRRSLASKDRGYFEDEIEALKTSGQVAEREVQSGQHGTEYRRPR